MSSVEKRGPPGAEETRAEEIRAEEIRAEVVRLSGLSALLGPGVLRRALSDVGSATPPTADDYLRALPKLEGRMRAYLPEEEVAERLWQIRRLLTSEPK